MIRTRKPHKQLLYLWVLDALTDSARFPVCLDLACGDMQLRPFVRSPTYIGVDSDRDRIERAALNHTDAQAIVSRIEDLKPDVRGDLVICIQTIGFNSDFIVANTGDVVRRCIAATAASGRLIINVGFRAAEYQESTSLLLRENFQIVVERRYGALQSRWPEWASLLAAKAMKSVPSTAVSEETPNTLFICDRRLV